MRGGGALNLSSQASFSIRHPELDSGSIHAVCSPSSVLRPPSPTTGEKGKESSRHPELVSGSQETSFAFTLAEVLVTLGIIGIVAAMTMPSLIGHYRKEETVSRLEKAYTIMNQALKRSEVDNGEYQHWETAFDIGAENYVNKYWVPYFNVAKLCRVYSDCGFVSNQPYYTLKGVKDNLNVAHFLLRIPFLTNDGIMYSISTSSGDATAADNSVYIDINAAKGPNTYGKDLFMFTRNGGKGILPLCNDSTDDTINESCSATGNGSCCAKKIMMDGWKINYKL